MATYVEEYTIKSIMGELKIDDTNWNNYVQTINGMGEEDCRSIVQAAYDRFKAR
jgi:hypothetical protein